MKIPLRTIIIVFFLQFELGCAPKFVILNLFQVDTASISQESNLSKLVNKRTLSIEPVLDKRLEMKYTGSPELVASPVILKEYPNQPVIGYQTMNVGVAFVTEKKPSIIIENSIRSILQDAGFSIVNNPSENTLQMQVVLEHLWFFVYPRFSNVEVTGECSIMVDLKTSKEMNIFHKRFESQLIDSKFIVNPSDSEMTINKTIKETIRKLFTDIEFQKILSTAASS
jgi:hypothetical protein